MAPTQRSDSADRTDAPGEGRGDDRPAAPLLVRRDQQLLVRNGNAITVTLQRAYLRHLGWLAGESVIVELYNNDSVLIRKPTADDFTRGPRHPVRLDRPTAVRA